MARLFGLLPWLMGTKYVFRMCVALSTCACDTLADEKAPRGIQNTTTLEIVKDFRLSTEDMEFKYGKGSTTGGTFVFPGRREWFIVASLVRCESQFGIPFKTQSLDRGILRRDGHVILEPTFNYSRDQILPEGTSFWSESPYELDFSRIDGQPENIRRVLPIAAEHFRVLVSTKAHLIIVHCRDVVGSEGITISSSPRDPSQLQPLNIDTFFGKWRDLSQKLADTSDPATQVDLFRKVAEETQIVPVWIERGRLRFPNCCDLIVQSDSTVKLSDARTMQEIGRTSVELYYPSLDNLWVRIDSNHTLPPDVKTFLMVLLVGRKQKILAFSTECQLPCVIDPSDFAQ